MLNNLLKKLRPDAGAQACNCTRLVEGSIVMKLNIYLNLYIHFFALVSRQSVSLSSATQRAMPPKFSTKRGTECLTTNFPRLSCSVQHEADLF